MSHAYKNKTDKELMLPNIGVVPAGAEFTSSHIIENPNVESTTTPSTDEPATDTNNEEATT